MSMSSAAARPERVLLRAISVVMESTSTMLPVQLVI